MADNALRVEIITRDFNRMLEELAAIDTTIEFKDVVKGTAERVVGSAQRFTKAAEPGKIRAHYATKQYTSFGGKVYKLSNRMPDATWGGIDRQNKENLQTKLSARGLSKQSWQWVAESFGRTVAGAPGYVTAANYRSRQYPVDGASTEQGDASAYTLEIANTSPIVQAASGRNALLRAMKGETRYFEMNMEKRAFATLESRVKKYPGIFLTRSI